MCSCFFLNIMCWICVVVVGVVWKIWLRCECCFSYENRKWAQMFNRSASQLTPYWSAESENEFKVALSVFVSYVCFIFLSLSCVFSFIRRTLCLYYLCLYTVAVEWNEWNHAVCEIFVMFVLLDFISFSAFSIQNSIHILYMYKVYEKKERDR